MASPGPRRGHRRGTRRTGSAVPAAHPRDGPFVPVEVDGPDHAQYRRIRAPRLSVGWVKALEPFVRETARELLVGHDVASATVDLCRSSRSRWWAGC